MYFEFPHNVFADFCHNGSDLGLRNNYVFDIGKRYLGPLDYFLSYFERSYGIIVFVVLILKRSTLKLLMER